MCRYLAVLFLGVFTYSFSIAIDLEKHPGKLIYKKQCADCHGANGEGNEVEDVEPLVGRRTLESLAGRIDRTMPEDDEDACVGEDAMAVAEYIYHAFYSVEARARKESSTLKPKLSRLTEDQFKNSVTDVFAHLRNASWKIDDSAGTLSASYQLKGRAEPRSRAKTVRAVTRKDPGVNFDFGEGIPDLKKEIEKALAAEKKRREAEAAKAKTKAEKDKKEGKKEADKPKKAEEKGPEYYNPKEFNISWRGSIFARESGVYEFFLKTRNGVYLNINEPDKDRSKLIDAWVAPDNNLREVSGKIYLQGGRYYPLNMEFFKYKEDKAYLQLLWKPPHGTKEVVPADSLYPGSRPQVFVSETRFPADDRSLGYETGSTVSRAWLDAVTTAALEAADHAIYDLTRLAKIRRDDPDEEVKKKVLTFANDFVTAALRRPLSDAERKNIIDSAFSKESGNTTEQSIRLIVLKVLTSPEFLYPTLDTPPGDKKDSWENAKSLAVTLWDSVPDRFLRASAEKGELDTPQRLERWAERMLTDTRTHHKLDGFFHHWLELERIHDLAKDKKMYPDFDEGLIADLTQSLYLFVDEIVWSDKSDYRKLLLSTDFYINDRIAEVYRYKEPIKRGQFQKVSFSKEPRSGVITHPLLLSAQAYHNNSSPIHRGVFLAKNVVGLPLKPPKEAIVFKDDEFDPSLTMREKVTKMTQAKACMACHASINPLGFSLEHFDAIGRWRSRDAGKPVDDDTSLVLDGGETHQFKSPKDLAKYAAESPDAHRAFIRQLFHHLVKQPMEAYGLDTEKELYEYFASNDYHIRKLIVKIAVIAATRAPSYTS